MNDEMLNTDGKATIPSLRLYDTLRKEKVAFEPLDPANVRMYVCGPTVYDFAHIGNARPVIVFDVLFRLLRHLYGADHVNYARNITDVDDKINARAVRDFPDLPLNEAIGKVTAATETQFKTDVAALGCLAPTHEPRATEHIAEMCALIERLVDRGVAYIAEDHVLFSPSAMERMKGVPKYGSLARRPLDEMIAGARVDVAPYKRDVTDFVLWKPSKDGEPGWPSPCDIAPLGRPGWHIECSAMSMAKLLTPFGGGLTCDDPGKNTFDIHGGGIDLVFPHHENEIAQSCCAFGQDGVGSQSMAQIWMHNGFLQVEGEKMSKSLGNFVTIHELLHTDTFGGRKWPGEVLRFAMLKTHYRQPIDWTVKALEEAEKTLERFSSLADIVAPMFEDRSAFTKPPMPSPGPSKELVAALMDDMNTPAAMAALYACWKIVEDANAGTARDDAMVMLVQDMECLGIDLLGYRSRVADRDAQDKIERGLLARQLAPQVDTLITARISARNAKDFAESDRIRDELVAMGIQIMDGKDPVTGDLVTKWEVKR
jgi:cysteinyl-tRNA synthetase